MIAHNIPPKPAHLAQAAFKEELDSGEMTQDDFWKIVESLQLQLDQLKAYGEKHHPRQQ